MHYTLYGYTGLPIIMHAVPCVTFYKTMASAKSPFVSYVIVTSTGATDTP